MEQKLQRFFAWIDIMDFFCTYDTAFGPGFTFSPAEILVRSRIDMDLEMKLDGLKKHTGGKDKRKDILDTILDRMTKEGFIERVKNKKLNLDKSAEERAVWSCALKVKIRFSA